MTTFAGPAGAAAVVAVGAVAVAPDWPGNRAAVEATVPATVPPNSFQAYSVADRSAAGAFQRTEIGPTFADADGLSREAQHWPCCRRPAC